MIEDPYIGIIELFAPLALREPVDPLPASAGIAPLCADVEPADEGRLQPVRPERKQRQQKVRFDERVPVRDDEAVTPGDAPGLGDDGPNLALGVDMFEHSK